MSRLLVAAVVWCALLAAGVPAQGALALVTAGAVAWWCRGRAGAGRAAVGHSHGGRVAVHEAGHVAAARAIGGGGIRVRTSGGGGWTDAPGAAKRATTAQWVGFLRAGQYAAGSGAGCGSDRAAVRRELSAVPRADRARVEREGDRLARRWVAGARAQIRQDAATIERTGRL